MDVGINYSWILHCLKNIRQDFLYSVDRFSDISIFMFINCRYFSNIINDFQKIFRHAFLGPILQIYYNTVSNHFIINQSQSLNE